MTTTANQTLFSILVLFVNASEALAWQASCLTPRVDLHEVSLELFHLNWARPLTKSAKCCFLSHVLQSHAGHASFWRLIGQSDTCSQGSNKCEGKESFVVLFSEETKDQVQNRRADVFVLKQRFSSS